MKYTFQPDIYIYILIYLFIYIYAYIGLVRFIRIRYWEAIHSAEDEHEPFLGGCAWRFCESSDNFCETIATSVEFMTMVPNTVKNYWVNYTHGYVFTLHIHV